MSISSNNTRQSLKVPKPILLTAKILEVTSPKLAARFGMKIFTTPMKFALPKREQKMDAESRQEELAIPSIDKGIHVYHLGDSPKKVLLVHGWSGRGTQLYSIAEKLIKAGYSTVSFDAPAHGKSPGKNSDMTEFVAAIHELNKKYGPFEFAVGHSLGAMAVLNAIKQGFKVKKAVTVGSGDIIEDIMDDFTKKMGMEIATGKLMIKLFEKKFKTSIDTYSAYMAAKDVHIPVLMFHDEEDDDVPVTAAVNIFTNLSNGELVMTQGLGHRKILGDSRVIKRIVEFLTKNDEQNTGTTADVLPDSVRAGEKRNKK